MLAQLIARSLRDECHVIRNAIIDLGEAFASRNLARVRTMMEEVATVTGLHLRYEEEALFPVLRDFCARERIERSLDGHDQIIGTLKRLMMLARKERIGRRDAEEAAQHVESILQCLGDCEEVERMVGRVPDEKLRSLEAGSEGAGQWDLVEWADGVRDVEAKISV